MSTLAPLALSNVAKKRKRKASDPKQSQTDYFRNKKLLS